MKLLLILLFLFSYIVGVTQTKYNGIWQGIMYTTSAQEGTLLYIDFGTDKKNVTGTSREVLQNSDEYSIHKLKGTHDSTQIKFRQYYLHSKKLNSKVIWQQFEARLSYVDSTGYLVGTFIRNNDKKQGKIILYPSKFSHQNITAQQSPSPHWVKTFINDIKLNKKSPHLREKERGDFAFKPIYFDYDKFEIKEEYFSFLKSMIEVISEHSDLRIKITGHTDPDGSDAYNNELSKKRANAIQDFFVKNGLNVDKLVIDFKGEKELINPTDQSENGKQLNRRVDFVFI